MCLVLNNCNISSKNHKFSIPIKDKSNQIIDGKLDDKVWKNTNPIAGLLSPWNNSGKDNTEFRCFISNNIFYFSFKVNDNTLTTCDYKEELSVAKEDRVEIFFSNHKDLEEYYCIEIDPLGRVLDYSAKYYRKFNENWNFKSKDIKAQCINNTYTVEGEIDLTLTGISTDNLFIGVFRADFRSNNPDDVVWYSLIKPDSTIPDFHIPSAFIGVK